MNIQASEIRYQANETTLHGYLARPQDSAPKAGVLIFPEWWGLTDYIQQRAQQLAEQGYVALGVDMYGEGKTAADPGEAGRLMQEVLSDMSTGEARVLAAMECLGQQADVDPDRLGAIGYCFGGAVVLHSARKGFGLKAVACFHGALDPMLTVLPGSISTKILVCHGEADAMVTAEKLEKFREEMNNLQADCKIVVYPGALHGFTNPATTEIGKKFGIPLGYQAEADQQSWSELLNFLADKL